MGFANDREAVENLIAVGAFDSLAPLVEGIVQRQEGVVSVLARRLGCLSLDSLKPPPAREFR